MPRDYVCCRRGTSRNLAGFSKHLLHVTSQASHSLCGGDRGHHSVKPQEIDSGSWFSNIVLGKIIILVSREDWLRGLTGSSAEHRER